MNKPVAQAMSVSSAIVIAIDRKTGDQWVINGITIVTVALVPLYWGPLLMAMNVNRKAVDVDGGAHHGVVSVAPVLRRWRCVQSNRLWRSAVRFSEVANQSSNRDWVG